MIRLIKKILNKPEHALIVAVGMFLIVELIGMYWK